MPRSALPIALLVLGLVLAGCTSYSAPPGRTEKTDACELRHEVSEAEEYGGYQGEEIPFSNLSEQGQHVFSRTLDGGNYSFAYDGANDPPDFSYSDQAALYEVRYRSEQYVLSTYTGSGCVVE